MSRSQSTTAGNTGKNMGGGEAGTPSEAERVFVGKATELFRRAVETGRAAGHGKVFDALHAVVVDEGPDLLSKLTEGATEDVSRDLEDREQHCDVCKKKSSDRRGP